MDGGHQIEFRTVPPDFLDRVFEFNIWVLIARCPRLADQDSGSTWGTVEVGEVYTE